MSDEIFESSVRRSGDRAGVFEYDGRAGYFYLYEVESATQLKILDSIRVLVGQLPFSEGEIVVSWNTPQDRVGLFLGGVLWAVFNTHTNGKFGGDYSKNAIPEIPSTEVFDLPN